jgi:hypothetical protein
MASAPVEKEPYAVTPASSAAAMTPRTSVARSSGVALAVASVQAWGKSGTSPSGAGRPLQSGSSSTCAAIAPACSARRRRPSSSIRSLEATPTRLPLTKRRLIATFVSATFWWISLFANRVSAESSAMRSTSASVAPACSASCRTRSAKPIPAVGSAVIEVTTASPRPHHLPTPTRTSLNLAPDTP